MLLEKERDDKAAWRTRFSGMRNAMAPERRTEASASACMRLAEWAERQSYRSVMVYVSFRSELSMNDFIERSWKQGIEMIVPRCDATDRSMTLHALRSWDELMPGAYGILEPNPERTAAMPADFLPEAVIVPGLAFDRMGGRMGYGGGYYDRFAESANHRAAARNDKLLWIGAGFDMQLVERVPVEEHDLRLDGVVTENGLHLF